LLGVKRNHRPDRRPPAGLWAADGGRRGSSEPGLVQPPA
jgi:hypothetical protein